MPVGKPQDYLPPKAVEGAADGAAASQAEADMAASRSFLAPWSLQITASSAQTNGVYRGNDRVPNGTGAQTRFRQLSFQPTYEFSPEFRASFSLPIVGIKERQAFQPPVDKAGVGDVSVFAEWAPDAGGFTLLAGLKMPTGDTSDAPGPGLVPPTLLQQGSGTWDPLLGARYRTVFGEVGAHAEAFAQIPIGESDAGLNPGNLFYAAAGADYYGIPDFYPGVEFVATVRSRDWINSAALNMTGASLYFVKPQVLVDLGDGVTLSASARIPVAMRVNAMQVVPGVLYTLSLGLDF